MGLIRVAMHLEKLEKSGNFTFREFDEAPVVNLFIFRDPTRHQGVRREGVCSTPHY